MEGDQEESFGQSWEGNQTLLFWRERKLSCFETRFYCTSSKSFLLNSWVWSLTKSS